MLPAQRQLNQTNTANRLGRVAKTVEAFVSRREAWPHGAAAANENKRQRPAANDNVRLWLTLTTPYGNSGFTQGAGANYQRWLELTDPLGGMERVEFNNDATAVPVSEATEPAGMLTFNGYNRYRNTFYWDKRVTTQYGVTDFLKVHIWRWHHDANNPNIASPLSGKREGTAGEPPLDGPPMIWPDIYSRG